LNNVASSFKTKFIPFLSSVVAVVVDGGADFAAAD
jgi:hypothetical protein